MSIRVSCATWQLSRQVMLAASPEKNRHRKSDDCSEANPPGKFHRRQPTWRLVERMFVRIADFQDSSCHSVRQIADNGDDNKTDDHGNDVAVIAATRFGEHARQENAEDGTVGVTVNTEHDRDD